MDSIKAKTLYTGDALVSSLWINFKDDKIVSITEKPAGKTSGEFPVVTPAFVDPHCHIGMCRDGEPWNEDESNDKFDTFMNLANALDSIQMEDPAFLESIENGVLYSCVLPGSGNIIGGRSVLIRNYAENTNDALIQQTGLKAAFGYNPMSTREWKGSRPWTRMGCLAILRNELLEIIQKTKGKKKKGEPDKISPKQMILKDLLDGKDILRVHVHKSDDIAALLRFVDEFKFKITVEHAGDVHDGNTFGELAKRKIPVIYGPMDCCAAKRELQHKSWKNVKYLLDSKIKFGLMSDHPVIPQSCFYLTLRHFLHLGVSKKDAIGILTRENAEIIGAHKFIGTLSKGKWASFVCWNGDPFELGSYPVLVVAEGKIIFGGLK